MGRWGNRMLRVAAWWPHWREMVVMALVACGRRMMP